MVTTLAAQVMTQMLVTVRLEELATAGETVKETKVRMTVTQVSEAVLMITKH